MDDFRFNDDEEYNWHESRSVPIIGFLFQAKRFVTEVRTTRVSYHEHSD